VVHNPYSGKNIGKRNINTIGLNRKVQPDCFADHSVPATIALLVPTAATAFFTPAPAEANWSPWAALNAACPWGIIMPAALTKLAAAVVAVMNLHH
jgi:hypothetical protein